MKKFTILLMLLLNCCIPIKMSPTVSTLGIQEKSVPSIAAFQTRVSPMPAATITSAPTTIQVKTPTYIDSTKIVAPTEKKTPTFLPTLLPSLAQKQVLELLKNNGNCSLPCWWGLIPGKASFESVNKLLLPLSNGEPYFAGNMLERGTAYYHLPLPENLSVQGGLYARFSFEKGMLSYTKISEAEWPAYHLSSLLDEYGPPGEVWLHTYLSLVEPNPPFSLFLFYPEKGILAYIPSRHPEKGEVQIIGEKIHACVPYSAILYLWSPSEKLSFAEVGKRFSVEDISQDEKPRLPLKEATGMDIPSFYQIYKNPNKRPCLDTPANLWPTF